MSLQLAAQHLASKGRGPDRTLVHMSPGEVASLQTLARAHGGTLTTNPDTGLPEAGFLSSILPIIAGAALGPAGVGLTAMQAGLATAALGAAATGSLKKGLMAGLGAYGGAGLMGSVTGAGEAALSAANAVSPTVGPAATAATQAVPVAVAPVAPVAPAAPVANAITPQGADILSREFGVDVASLPKPAVAAPVETVTPQPAIDTNVNARDLLLQRGAVESPAYDPRTYSFMDKTKAGLSAITDNPDLLFKKENMKYGLAALAPLMMQDQKQVSYKGSGPNPYQYAYNPGRVANPQRAGGIGEYNFFEPSYTRMADGGPVQAMSDRNDQEMFMTNGAQRFADGGTIEPPKYVFDPVTNTLKDVSSVQPVRTVTQMPSIGTREPYYDNSLSGEGPTPPNIGNAYGANGLPNAVTTAMVPIANALNITSPQQGLIMGLPNPLAMMGFAALGNAAQQAQNTNMSLIAESNSNEGASVPGTYDAGGFGSYGENVAPVASMGNDTVGFGSYGENVAPDDGVDVGGPIASGDVTGVDVGPADGGGGGSDAADGGGGGDGEKRGGLLRKRAGGLAAAYAYGGMSNLGSYSDGGRLLRGPGDGVSDSIPATIANKRPARLADGEFVVPARIVSELGNGSTEAGARKLYAMMERVQKSRNKTVGKGRVAVNSRAEKHLPA